jgi:outer membrane autotransporter protein
MTAEPMKTKHIKITNRAAKKLPCILAAFITWLLPVLVLIPTIESSFAASGTWVGGIDGDWNLFDPEFGSNWTGNVVPNGPSDTATFAVSRITSVFLSDDTEVNGIVFNAGASAFTITASSGFTLTISGVGITNNSGITQNFVTSSGSSNPKFFEPPGIIVFSNSATAGSNVTITNNGGVGTFGTGGITGFLDTSTAGNATITNNGGTRGGSGGITAFGDSSTAANATITNNGGARSGAGGITEFLDTSTAGNATITNNGGTFTGVLGGSTTFLDSSTAGNATLIANGGSGGGLGGTILFEDDSTGGTARVEVFGNGTLDISLHTAPGVSVGSIEGSGFVHLGSNNLTVGSNNLSTIFSGVIQDDVEVGGGSLTKVGTGTLTLTGLNTYDGLTTVSAGILNIQNGSGLGATTTGTTVSSGATLQLQGGVTVGAEALTISGIGAAGQNGALVNVSGTNNYGGLLTLGAASTISSDAGTLNLTNTGTITGAGFGLTLTGAGNGTISSIIGTGTGTLTKNGAGTWTLSGTSANTYTGLTTINAGELDLNKTAGVNAIAGNITIGDGSGTDTLKLLAANQISDTSVVTLTNAGSAVLNLNGNDETIGALTDSTSGASGASVQLGAGTLTFGDSTNHTFAGIISGTGGSVVKQGTGTQTLSGDNTYTGGTTISAGTLQLGNGGTSGSIVGDVIDNGTFAVNRSDTLSFGGIISGSGAFAQIGPGTTILTATNTYTGGTTISTGTLQLGNGGTSGSIVGDVADDGTFAVDRSDTLSFGGVISGSGAFAQIGPGTTVLTGANTYTGPTTVDAGTLLVDGSLLASAVTVNSGATLGGIGTAAGAVTINDGGILAPGDSPGTLTVGSLSLSNASLLNYELGTPGVIGSGVNDLTIVNGNLTLDGILNTTALGGFGPGAYRLFNYGGALTDNTLDIGTVPAGFLASNFIVITGLPNEVDVLVLAGPLPASVQFWDGTDTEGNGIIDGGTGEWDNFTTNWTDASGDTNSSWLNGVAVFAGTAGTVTVTAPIFFAGMEFMTDGYQIDQGGEGSLNLIGSPIITTDAGVTATINAPLAGEGGISKEGVGTLILGGTNTYLGNTTIDAGSLIVDGSIASALTVVNAGGLLGGSEIIGLGIIGGDLTNGGIVSPGDAPGLLGTLTVNGNYTQTTGGTLRIEIAGTAPGQFDLLAVGGHASLAGTLQLVSLGDFKLQVGDIVTFLTAAQGVSGTFSTILNPFVTNTLILAEINILANAVQLEGTQGSFVAFATSSGLTPNQIAVANALDSAVGDPRAADLIAFLDSEPLATLPHDFDLIAPEELAAIFNIDVSLANIQTVNLERRMEDIRAGSRGFSATGFAINTRGRDFNMGLAGPVGPEGKSGPSVMQPTPENRWGVFVTGLGEFTNVDSTSNARGYDLSTGGLTFGVDYRVCPNFAIGLTGGYAHTNADLVDNGSLDVDGGKIGVYATGFSGGFYVDAAATGGLNNYDSHRTALLGSARGDTNGHDFTGLIAAGYEWKKGALTIGPTASFQYTYAELDSFNERGSLVPLTFNDQDANSSRTALGAKASYDWHVGHVVVKPELRAAWQHEFGDTDYSLVSRFANGAGSSFTVHGPAIGRDSLLIGAGAAVLLNDRVSVYAYYDGELARTNYSSNNVSAGVRVSF